MARVIGRLNAVAIKNAKSPGMYPDGAGLYLRVGPTGAGSWVYKQRLQSVPLNRRM